VVSLLFGTGKPPSRDINSHNSHSTSFQIGDYERGSCCELMSRVVRSVSNKNEITILQAILHSSAIACESEHRFFLPRPILFPSTYAHRFLWRAKANTIFSPGGPEFFSTHRHRFLPRRNISSSPFYYFRFFVFSELTLSFRAVEF
jgi:hypothetical protein